MPPRQLLLFPRQTSTPKPTSLRSHYLKPTTSKRFFRESTQAKMPTYIVTCKPDASAEHIAAAKKHAEDQGGKIGHEYNLIKGFSYVATYYTFAFLSYPKCRINLNSS
ncbi:hypothetical protein PG994_000262 [Apiospora phragmitis]|uniref:Inhibitor I9 domain-containing protein n=1 Tax=Apiospora phragmitis TaxID=2905665 RepID=A0ABR1X5U6_9PEZI